jgi:hypothetical protein
MGAQGERAGVVFGRPQGTLPILVSRSVTQPGFGGGMNLSSSVCNSWLPSGDYEEDMSLPGWLTWRVARSIGGGPGDDCGWAQGAVGASRGPARGTPAALLLPLEPATWRR